MEVEITLNVTKNFPNNAGEIGLYDLYQSYYKLIQGTKGYRLEPEIWIGEKELWGTQLPAVYKKSNKPYLAIIASNPNLSISQQLRSGRGIELNAEEARSIINDALNKRLVMATDARINQYIGDSLLKSKKAYLVYENLTIRNL